MLIEIMNGEVTRFIYAIMEEAISSFLFIDEINLWRTEN